MEKCFLDRRIEIWTFGLHCCSFVRRRLGKRFLSDCVMLTVRHVMVFGLSGKANRWRSENRLNNGPTSVLQHISAPYDFLRQATCGFELPFPTCSWYKVYRQVVYYFLKDKENVQYIKEWNGHLIHKMFHLSSFCGKN